MPAGQNGNIANDEKAAKALRKKAGRLLVYGNVS